MLAISLRNFKHYKHQQCYMLGNGKDHADFGRMQPVGLDVVWDLDLYGRLLETGGGKERMTAYFSVRHLPISHIE